MHSDQFNMEKEKKDKLHSRISSTNVHSNEKETHIITGPITMILHCARDAEENAFDACSMQWKAIQVQCVKTCFHVVPRYPCRCIWMCARMCVGVLFSFSLFVVFFLLFIYLGWCCTVISHIQPTQIHMHIFIELEPIQLNLCYVENNCLLPMVFFLFLSISWISYGEEIPTKLCSECISME